MWNLLAEGVDPGQFGFGAAVGAVISSPISWFLKARLTHREAEKCSVETIRLQGETWAKLDEACRIHEEANDAAIAAGNALFAALQQNQREPGSVEAKHVDELREDFNAKVFGRAINTMVAALQQEYLSVMMMPLGVEQLIDGTVLPDLQKIKRWLVAVNSPPLLKLTGRVPLKLSAYNFRRFRMLGQGVDSANQPAYYAKIDAAIADLCE